MSSDFGKLLHISLFGESHGPAIGVTLDGLPAGEAVDMEEIARQMTRRAPGRDPTATPRREQDRVEPLSGLLNGKTTGAPLCAIIRNEDTDSGAYSEHARIPRPGHADYTAQIRYGGHQDIRGGGHFSGRLTAPLVFAGALCRQLLVRRGIYVGGHVYSIGDVNDLALDPVNVSAEVLKELAEQPFPVLSADAREAMRRLVGRARERGDSVGGIVEAAAYGLPAGLGSPIFGGVESVLSALLFGIPAVKGVEFGAGFSCAGQYGHEHNDPFCMDAQGHVRTVTNNHGGILGGITTGMPLMVRVAFKPTPSIAIPQKSVDMTRGCETEVTVRGRHDPCIVPRAVPVVEAALNVGLLNLWMESGRK